MAKYRNNVDPLMEGILMPGGKFFLFSAVSPDFRQLVSTVGALAMLIFGVGVVGLLCMLVIRKLARNSHPSARNSGSRRTLRGAQTLHSYNLATLELVEAKPPAAAGDRQLRLKVRVPPSPIDVPPAKAQPVAVVHAGFVPPVKSASMPPMAPQKKPPLSPVGLLDRLRAIDWFQFEKVVARLYEKQGYRVNRRGGANPDGGIDMVIEKPGLRRAVQCKQWRNSEVGVKPMREFVGALHSDREDFQSGIFVTLRGYSVPAKQLAELKGIEMLDADDLARKLEAVGARHDPEILELLADERKFCPRCEAEMVLRTAKKGANPGSQFWGCSTYPQCKYRM